MTVSDSTVTVPRFVHLVADPDYQAVAAMAEDTLDALLRGYPKAARMHALLCRDPEANALWEMANFHTVAKLGFNDHGPIHAHLAAAAGAQLLELLLAAGQTSDFVRAGMGDEDDAFALVIAACLLHDVGNGLNRDNQGANGVTLAQPLLRRLLPAIYDDPRQATLIQTFILSAISTHGADPEPRTLEAGVVAVADATDMTSGRGKIAFAQGKVDIHAVSALAIERVLIKPGDGPYAVAIEIDMTSEAGLFQVEETLVRKLKRTPLRDLIAVRACMRHSSHPETPNIIDCVTLDGGALMPASDW